MNCCVAIAISSYAQAAGFNYLIGIPSSLVQSLR
jgi:hypothetical protein